MTRPEESASLRRTTRRTPALLALALLLTAASVLQAADKLRSEYQVKAAFLVTFLKYVEIPEGDPQSGPIQIGILGEEPSNGDFAGVPSQVLGRQLVVSRIADTESTEDLAGYDLIFVSAARREETDRILELLQDTDVLTVGESPGFLEKGGVINFVLGNEDGGVVVGFEINQQAAHVRGIRIDTDLLQRAGRVIRKS